MRFIEVHWIFFINPKTVSSFKSVHLQGFLMMVSFSKNYELKLMFNSCNSSNRWFTFAVIAFIPSSVIFLHPSNFRERCSRVRELLDILFDKLLTPSFVILSQLWVEKFEKNKTYFVKSRFRQWRPLRLVSIWCDRDFNPLSLIFPQLIVKF